MNKNFLKKIISIGIIAICTLGLTGCSGEAPEQIKRDVTACIDARVAANRILVENLYESGLINAEARDNYYHILETNYAELEEVLSGLVDGSNISAKGKELLNCIVDWHAVTMGDLESAGKITWITDAKDSNGNPIDPYWDDPYALLTDSALDKDAEGKYKNNIGGVNSEKFISNYLVANENETIKDAFDNSSVAKGGSIGYKTIIEDKDTVTITNSLTWGIFILNPDKMEDGTSSLATLHNLLVDVKTAVDSGSNLANGSTPIAALNSYFKELKDSDGNSISLADPDDIQYDIIRPSINGRVYESSVKSSLGSYDVEKNYIFTRDKAKPSSAAGSTADEPIDKSNYLYDHNNAPGMDLIIEAYDIPVLVVRVSDFSQMAYNNIASQVGLDKSKYLIVNASGGGNAYLLQYPVGYVEGFSYDKDTDKYETIITKSGNTSDKEDDHPTLELNLLTGKLVKKGSTLPTTTTSTEAEDTENIVTVDSDDERYILATAATAENCSFVVKGETGLSVDGGWGLKFGASETEASIPRIVLRDYLEASYTPDLVSGEDLVVYGRMLRITNFGESLTSTVAKYVDSTGAELSSDDTAFSFKVYDFSDVGKATADIPYNMHMIESSSAEDSAKDSITFESDGSLQDYTEDPVRLDELQQLATTENITTTTPFPGGVIGNSDKDSFENVSDKPMFYAMLTNVDLYTTGTMMNWINNSSDSESIVWWNTWLTNHSYVYQLDIGAAKSYLSENYKYELAQEGILVLDLDTISKIQEHFEEMNNNDVVGTFRAFTKILGYFLIVYAVMLTMAWLFDTNISPGVQLLQKITFGKMIAVSAESEMPTVGDERSTYVGIGSVVKASLCIAILGIILSLFDALTVLYKIASIVGSIATKTIAIIKEGVT